MRTITGLINKYTERKLNILCCPTHERYQNGFSDVDANFYMIYFDGCKEWVDEYAKIPKNHFLWPKNVFPRGIRFDCVLSQSKFSQFQFLSRISKELHIPLISLEHTLPVPGWKEDQLKRLKHNMSGDLNVFISEYSRNRWGYKEEDSMVVHHMVNTELFKPGKNNINKVLSVVNDFKNRDIFCGYNLYNQVRQGMEDSFVLFGDNPGLSRKAESVEELSNIYSSNKIFLNTSLVSPIPTALLEAMSSGCAVISTATCMIPEIIQNGVNGFISNDVEELREYVSLLLSDNDLCEELGREARKTIERNFNKEKFTKSWSSIFKGICK